ncbi:hypothetical protein GALL_481310 [mine drainage metagenome]|uniref:Uncharacterized protein n=1 Tax=mine drainage metagenome TaxID=410659 RepID=A0A1J5PHJ7_9ZZZZ
MISSRTWRTCSPSVEASSSPMLSTLSAWPSTDSTEMATSISGAVSHTRGPSTVDSVPISQ